MLALALLLACKPPVDTDDTDRDTDPGDTDPGDTDDTDVPGEVTLRLVPTEAAFEGAPLGLYPLNASFTAVTSETAVVSVGLAEGIYEVRFTPAETDLVPAPWAEGLQVAAYALVAGSGTTSWVGIARMDALYVVGTVPPPYSDIGLHEGWNVLWVSGEEQPPVVGDPLDLPIEPNLQDSASATASGTWNATMSAERSVAISTEDAAVTCGDGVAADPWSVSCAGQPAESAIRDLDGVRVAGFSVHGYADADASGSYTTGDTLATTAYTPAGEAVYVAWGEAPDTLDEAHRLVTLGGFRVGWSVVASPGEGSRPLSEAEASALEMR
jgi:hypothetical protein